MTRRDALSVADRERLSAEYALGVVEGDALAEANRLHATDPEFREDALLWSSRFATLLDDVEAVDPPSELLPAILAQLPRAKIHLGRPGDLRRWQAATAAMMALAAGLTMFIIVRPPTVVVRAPPLEGEKAERQPMVAAISGDGSRVVANWDGDGKLFVVPVEVPKAPDGRAHELWMIPNEGKPRSMGLMPEGPIVLNVARETADIFAVGATFAISIEPQGGSPTGQPTGPVIASGKLIAA